MSDTLHLSHVDTWNNIEGNNANVTDKCHSEPTLTNYTVPSGVHCIDTHSPTLNLQMQFTRDQTSRSLLLAPNPHPPEEAYVSADVYLACLQHARTKKFIHGYQQYTSKRVCPSI